MLKKYINRNEVADVPRNGVITIDIVNEDGSVVKIDTGISNLSNALETDIELANKNGYYEYVENDEPEYNPDTQYINWEYILENNVITKTYTVNDIEEE